MTQSCLRHSLSREEGMLSSAEVEVEEVNQDFMEKEETPVELGLPCGQGTVNHLSWKGISAQNDLETIT